MLSEGPDSQNGLDGAPNWKAFKLPEKPRFFFSEMAPPALATWKNHCHLFLEGPKYGFT